MSVCIPAPVCVCARASVCALHVFSFVCMFFLLVPV